MLPSAFARFADVLRADHAAGRVGDAPTFAVPAARYRDQAVCDRERATLFRLPRIVAASTELPPGACVPVELPGTAALLTRHSDGRVRAFANACRHRGTRLVDAPCTAKAMVCPYHGWTYDPTGALVHVPHLPAFSGLTPATRGLVEIPVAERHGLVWLGAGADTHASELDADLATLALDRHVVYRRARTTRRCNWKLVVEAFLDGYHIRVLHRGSIYRFFLDAASKAEPLGTHIRALTARRTLLEAPRDLDGVDLRVLGTPSYLVFPSTVIIEHPDFVSIIGLHPVAPDLTAWDHAMLVPERTRDADAEHWAKSWELIEETVFQKEDLWVCEQIQRSVMAEATNELLFGALEEPIQWFHDAVDAALR